MKFFLLPILFAFSGIGLFAQTGNVGIGTNTPVEKLDVSGNAIVGDGAGGNNTLYIRRVDGNNAAMGLLSNAGREIELFNYSGGEDLTISCNSTLLSPGVSGGRILIGENGGSPGLTATLMTIDPELTLVDVVGTLNCTGGTCSSDRRWKKDIKPLENVMNRIQKINGVSYYWNQEDFKEKNFNDRKQIGVIAQEVEEVFPELIRTDTEGFKSMDYQSLTAVLLEAIKEQQAMIEAQNKKIDGLEAQNAQIQKLSAQVKMLSNAINTVNAVGQN